MSKYDGHTPGPWYHNDGIIQADAAWYETVCEMPTWGPYQDNPDISSMIEAESAANAALIADAPELLWQRNILKEAIERTLNFWQNDDITSVMMGVRFLEDALAETD